VRSALGALCIGGGCRMLYDRLALTNMGQTSDQDQSDCMHLVSSPSQYRLIILSYKLNFTRHRYAPLVRLWQAITRFNAILFSERDLPFR
ncbi:MAG TPA: hypothetical protein VJ251_13465, partial [Stellaceae bacterium]|nr:hypothetical protein [Stellaceae bacterium]